MVNFKCAVHSQHFTGLSLNLRWMQMEQDQSFLTIQDSGQGFANKETEAMPTKIYLGTVDKSLTSKNDFITHDKLRTNFF